MKRHLAILAGLLSVTFFSCDKNGPQVIDAPVTANSANIKFFNFGTNAPSANFYANGTKVSAISSGSGAESTAGTANGGVCPSSRYAFVPAGAYTVKAQIPSTAATDPNLAIATAAVTLAQNKYYSMYMAGRYVTATKTSDIFIVEDVLPATDFTVATVRFVNTIDNGTENMNLVAKNTSVTPNTETVVATNIGYKGASAFVSLPPGSYELYVRYPSAPATNVISRTAATNGVVAFVGGRAYTIGAKGDMTVTSTTAANRPLLDNTAHR